MNPRAALRRISSAASNGSLRYTIPQAIIRLGYAWNHSVHNQSFHAFTAAFPTSTSLACANTRPQNPVIIEGKLSIAQIPPRFMSATRAWMS